MKKSKITNVAVDRLRINEGQLDWLPKNPRQWTQADIDRMAASVDRDPDFAEDRPVLAVYAPDGTLVVFAHNLLTKAAQIKALATLPAVIYEPETDEDRETIVRRAILDNGSFGSWDTQELANWDVETWQLEDWGVPTWVTGGAGKQGRPAAQGSAPGEQAPPAPSLVATIVFPDAESLNDFVSKYAAEIEDQYDATIIC